MKIYIIQYYNVLFYLISYSKEEDFRIRVLEEHIRNGTLFTMEEIRSWCMFQDVEFRTKFKWSKRYNLWANLWNLYSYYRFKCRI